MSDQGALSIRGALQGVAYKALRGLVHTSRVCMLSCEPLLLNRCCGHALLQLGLPRRCCGQGSACISGRAWVCSRISLSDMLAWFVGRAGFQAEFSNNRSSHSLSFF